MGHPVGKVDPVAFCQMLRHSDWSPVWFSYGPELKWREFQRIFLDALDHVAPLRRTRTRDITGPPLSADTRQLLRRRRAALKQNNRDLYRVINKQCRAAIRSDSRAHFQREIDRRGRSGLWRALTPIIGKKQTASEPPNITPDALNNFYVTIGPTTAASVPAPTAPVHIRLPRVTSGSFKVQPIDIDTLLVTLLSMKPSNSTGNDGVSVAMLQKFSQGIVDVLLDIVNASLHTGQVPASWKHALVIPIPKGKTSKKPADTRPISILPAIMKIIEKIVQIQLTEYLESHHLLSFQQHGYRKLHSTESALHVITDKALQAMERGEISILTLLDQSKCFDVVPHQPLLDKLSMYGIDIAWFKNYLSGHTQQVLIRGADGTTIKSQTRNNTIGVFQGGSLSCCLYMLFSNDLCLHVDDDVTVVQYADDVQLLVSAKKQHLTRLVTRMESSLNTLFQWFCQHNMKVNESKTQMVVIGTPPMLRQIPPVTIKFNGSLVPDSKSVKKKPGSNSRPSPELPGPHRQHDKEMHWHSHRAESCPARYS